MSIPSAPHNEIDSPLTIRKIFPIYLPLAASWLLMGFEGPALGAIIARLPQPEINLAAYGGVAFAIALIIEAPIIMLLAASTALCRDWKTYRNIWRFMMVSSAILTSIHVLIAFTPLYDLVARDVLGVPEEIFELGRLGLKMLTPWTWAIAYRRFQQGVLIRFGRSYAVGIGTIVRLMGVSLTLGIGYWIGTIPGAAVGCAALSVGVMAEAVYAGIVVRPVIRDQVKKAPEVEALRWSSFFAFYIPLAMTSVLSFFWQPIGSAAMSRMSQPIDSLAVFPIVNSLLFILRSFGLALNEVVVSTMDRKGSYQPLHKFTMGLLGSVVAISAFAAFTPISDWWFSNLSALKQDLAALGGVGLTLGIMIPALVVLQSWYQGSLVYGRQTRGVPESLVVFFVTVLIVLAVGVVVQEYAGVLWVTGGATLANITQTLWLYYRSRGVINRVRIRDVSEDGRVGS